MRDAIPHPERVETRSEDGTPIVCDVYATASSDFAVVVPGFWRDRRHPSMQTLATRLVATGRSVAVVDVRGHGESGGTYGFNLHEHEDVAAAIEAVRGRYPVSAIDVVGLSMGGAIAISTITRHRNLPWRSALLISSVAEFATIRPRINLLSMHRHLALRQAFRRPKFDWHFRKSRKLRALDDVADIGVPLCLVHMKDDWLIGHSHSERLFEAAREPKEVHVLDLPGAFHADRILSEAEREAWEIISSFLARQKQKAALSRG